MSFRTSPRFLPIAVALLLGVTGLSAQGTFVIPAGFGAIDGAGTSFPFGNTNDHIWQWHYDASEFINAGINFPIAITNVAVRADSPTATVPAFNFPSVEIELIEASTNWANGTHNTTFAANILTSSIVRTAAPWVGGPVPPSGGATAPFIPIGFDAGASFIFDPTAGNDFIIQVRKCGTIASWGVTMDGANLANATRYGHSSSCTATVSTFSNPTFCPIAELTWQPVVLAPDDIQVQDVTAPVTGVNACTPLSVFEIVTATLRNAGANPIVGGTQIPVSYTIDGGVNVTSEIFTPAVTLNPGDTASFSFATGANMSTPGIYTVAVTASWGLDGNPMNDSRSVTVESIGGVTINSFPWTENFDGFGAVNGGTTVPPGWENDPSDAGGSGTNGDWFTRNGTLPSTTTGPAADHTTGLAGGGFYYQVEDTGNFSDVNLLTPCIDLAGLTNPIVTFWLHSKNATVPPTNFMNTLSLDVVDASGTVFPDVAGPIGHLGDSWTIQGANLSAFLGQKIQLRFRGRSDAGGTVHDVCIDDVSVFNGVPGSGQAPQAGLAVLDISGASDGLGLPVQAGNAGIHTTTVATGELVAMHFEGVANQAIVVLYGPANAGLVNIPNIGQFDIGTGLSPMGTPTGLQLFADGTQFSFPNVFFRIPTVGAADLSFSMPALPPGYVTTFQALIFTAGPSVVALSNAVTLNTM